MQIIPFDQTAQGLKDISYSKELAYIKKWNASSSWYPTD